jgi:hypothetical protein
VPRKYDLDPKLGNWVETCRLLWNRDFKQHESEAKGKSPPIEVAASPLVPLAAAVQLGALAGADGDDKPAAALDGVLMDTATGKLPARCLTQEQKDRLDKLGFVW